MREVLMPTLEALYKQDPESLPFRQPVDPQLLGIPVRTPPLSPTDVSGNDPPFALTFSLLLSSAGLL